MMIQKMMEQLNNSIDETRDKREKIHRYINDAFTGVFVHRYRDFRAPIRALVTTLHYSPVCSDCVI
jgi:hypothetical protein